MFVCRVDDYLCVVGFGVFVLINLEVLNFGGMSGSLMLDFLHVVWGDC